METLTRDSFLQFVNVSENNRNEITGQVNYRFSDMSTFQQWFHSISVQDLIQSIEQNAEEFRQSMSSN